MCETGLPTHPRLPARDYFGEAKKRSRQLAPLKSVSRAYRASAVRELKLQAVQKERDDVSRQSTEEATRRAAEALAAGGLAGAHNYNNVFTSSSYGGSIGITGLGIGNAINLYTAQQAAGISQYRAYQNSLALLKPVPLPTEIKAGELVGWRCWLAQPDGTFQSMVVSTNWKLGETIEGDVGAGHGVHAHKTEQQARDYALGYPGCPVVIGTVELWGQVVEHEWGYRAQYGQIKEIVDKPKPRRRQRLPHTYVVRPSFQGDGAYESADAFVIAVIGFLAIAIGGFVLNYF